MDPEKQAKLQYYIESSRHYGNMQFAMFTVFTAITGFLVRFSFTDIGTIFLSVYPQKVLFCISFSVLLVVFILVQGRCTSLIHFYQQKTIYELGRDIVPKSHKYWVYVARWVLIAPYIIAIVYCTFLLLGAIDLNV